MSTNMAPTAVKKWKRIFVIFAVEMILNHSAAAQAVSGPYCYQCDDVPFQRDCGRTVKCGPHESCYGGKYITSDGKVYFRSGCKGTNTCLTFQNKRKRDAMLCNRCCSGNYCNLDTCDLPPPTHDRRCLACDGVIDPVDCNRARQCDSDEMCFTESVLSVNGELRFRLGCAKKTSCSTVGLPSVVGRRYSEHSAAGRRAVNLNQYANMQYCARCCDYDNCNRDLCGGELTGTALTLPPPYLFCYDIDVDYCAALVGSISVCVDLKIKYLLCPRTCGTCSGTGVINPPGGVTDSTPSTKVPSTQATTPHGSCFDRGDRCSEDPDVKNLVCSVDPHLCEKTCGVCGTITTPSTSPQAITTPSTSPQGPNCTDPIPECQCAYMDRELHICSDGDGRLKMFCCYYCKKKKSKTFTCSTDRECVGSEAPEWNLVKDMTIGCHDDISF